MGGMEDFTFFVGSLIRSGGQALHFLPWRLDRSYAKILIVWGDI